VNIKERLDFSCALFDGEGNLIANAPHMPVHLGSMGESIKTVIRLNAATMKPGNVYVLNAPYNGGTHLPDVTVITPVFDQAGKEVLFYVGSRGHHADIGGITPGSMPPGSKVVEEEGVLIDNFLLVEEGRFREEETVALLARAVPGAQRAAEHRRPAGADRGQREGRAGAAAHGRAFRPRRGARLHAPRAGQRRGIGAPRDRRAEGRQFDCRWTTARSSRCRSRSTGPQAATIDFTGTSRQLPNNFNAPSAVCMAAVLYVFRTLVDDEIPLNAGCLKPLEW
jgi:5-oxoprolinase (ATP-hydrolysing)